MPRVAGADPGTSSLDLLVLDDGQVVDQVRFPPEKVQADPQAPVRWLKERGPFDVIAGPSGYGIPLVAAEHCADSELDLMALVRPDERGRAHGVAGFSALLRAFRDSGMRVVFLPGVIHLPTVPAHRKLNRIDLGTADKLCVAALAIDRFPDERLCVVELGSAFTACLAVDKGRIVDGVGGTSGPIGWRSSGAWDGEAAYLLSPLSKGDLFEGGVGAVPEENLRRVAMRESLTKAVAALQVSLPFERILVSGQLPDSYHALRDEVTADLSQFCEVSSLPVLPGAWVKHAAQGAALIADGMVGGRRRALVERLQLHKSRGTVLDWLHHPRAADLRRAFNLP